VVVWLVLRFRVRFASVAHLTGTTELLTKHMFTRHGQEMSTITLCKIERGEKRDTVSSMKVGVSNLGERRWETGKE